MDADGTPLAVLFADVSGSTSLYEKLGNSQALRMVNACLDGMKAEVGKHKGTIVKTIGDEIVARFDSADQALQAASAMQAALRVQAETAPQLAVKIGFTFGPVIQQHQDVFGDVVNLAARIVSLANPGQILTHRQAVEALAPSLRATCRKLYTTSVRGKTEKISVFEVIWRQDQGLTVVGSGPPTLYPPSLVSLKISYQSSDWALNEDRQTLSIGREPDNDLTVAADKVSRHHAKIFLRSGKFVLLDKSANGTYVHADQRDELLLRREELVLSGRGRIGLGRSVVESGKDAISYEIE